jgi:serine/threonine-protein kinase RsbW
MSIPSETKFLGLVREVTEQVARAVGFDAPTAGQIALAVDEAASNSIEHAYAGAAGHVVDVSLFVSAARFEVEVQDDGEAVETLQLSRLDLERYARERRTGGLGIHLMERIMDSVAFRRVARRNVCAMARARPEAASPSE